MRLAKLQRLGVLLVLTAAAFAACGGASLAMQLRVILGASTPLIESLPLPANVKSGLVADFTDLGTGALTLSDAISACGSAKPCKLSAVSNFEALFEQVEARGHMGSHPKIVTVEGIIKGIISSLQIFYGGAPAKASIGRASTSNAPARVVTEKGIKAQIEALKVAMQP